MPSAPQDHKRKTTKKKASSAGIPATPIPVADPDPTGKYAPDAWLSGGIGGMEDLTVPSGQVCLVRRPGLEGLMKAGVLNRMDSLSGIVSEKHIKRVKGKGSKAAGDQEEIDALSLMNDPKAMDEVIEVVDKVVCHVVVKPEVHRTPNDVTLRKPGIVYADMVDIIDKMFIFNFVVGGTRDIATFRGGLDSVVGGLEDLEGVPAAAE